MMRKMKEGVMKPWAALPLHLVLGVVFAAHGSQKLFGWFGGGGIEGTTQFLGTAGFAPATFWAVVLGLAEFFGGVALLIGFLTHFAAFLLAIDMIIAIFLVHWSNGFFAGKGGIEFPLVILAGLLSIFLSGAAPCALDARLGWCPCCSLKKKRTLNEETYDQDQRHDSRDDAGSVS